MELLRCSLFTNKALTQEVLLSLRDSARAAFLWTTIAFMTPRCVLILLFPPYLALLTARMRLSPLLYAPLIFASILA